MNMTGDNAVPAARDKETLIDPGLLELLVCPEDKSSLVERKKLSGLECSECGRVYPVRDGVPVMLLDVAKLPEDGNGKI